MGDATPVLPETTDGRRACARCLLPHPVESFIGLSGQETNHCAVCRAKWPSKFPKLPDGGLPGHGKYCGGCKEIKPLTEFGRVNGEPRARCKLCTRVARRADYRNNPSRLAEVRRRNLARYGLTPEDYDRKHAEQNGLCAICGKPETATSKLGEPRVLCVDHNHTTGAVHLRENRTMDIPTTPSEPRCPRCLSPRWVSVSLDGGWTRRAQCVPCGTYHPGTIGPGGQSPRFGDEEAVHPAYREVRAQ